MSSCGRECRGDLLGRPSARGPLRHRHVLDVTPVVAEDDEDEQVPQGDARDDEEVAGRRDAEVVSQEGHPVLAASRLAVAGHVALDGRLTDVVAEQGELGLNARRAPGRVLDGHPADQAHQRPGDRRPAHAARPGLAAPVGTPARAVPLEHSGRLDEEQALTPAVEDTEHEDPEAAISVLDSRACHLASEDGELLSEGEVLEDEPLAWEEGGPESGDEGDEERHGTDRSRLRDTGGAGRVALRTLPTGSAVEARQAALSSLPSSQRSKAWSPANVEPFAGGWVLVNQCMRKERAGDLGGSEGRSRANDVTRKPA